MALIIETATKKLDGVTLDDGTHCDGFTSGDPQIGLSPTQLSAKYFDTLTAEVNNVIRGIHAPGGSLDPDNSAQAMEAINARLTSNWPKTNESWVFEWRSQYHAASASQAWLRRERSDRKENVADNADYNLAPFAPADLSQFLVTYVVVLVGTNNLTTRCIHERKASARRNGGAVTIQQQSAIFVDNPDSITITIEDLGAQVYCKVAVPALGENVNIFVTGTITNVTRDV